MSLYSFYVVEYPNETSRMGKVLWETGTNDRTTANEEAARRNKSNPWRDYEVSDMGR